MMKWLVNIANKSLLAITLLVINLWLLINDWSNHAFAGTMELDSSNKNEMIRFNVNNQFWQQPQGFLWYNEDHAYKPGILKFSQDKKKQEPELEPYSQRIEALKKEFNRAQHKALDDPTLENVIIVQRLHKQILEKSHKFATMWQLATILDYKLVNMDEPVNSLHKKLYEVRQEEENSKKLKFLAKNWGLILQINQGCNYCQVFTPIVREFADKYGFQLIFVSNSETRFQGMPTIKDTGLLQTLNPAKLVPVLYLVDSSGKQIYLIAKGIISENKISENILLIVQYYNVLKVSDYDW
ncbi:MAG: conjugal transfer protein TraF [Rickettsia endosymbiont of Ixodes persulcatus]|nr:conjugal transfer protein TraF [Rickettsia endosymbiont of Ixodes persulcatus]MCZ6902712.1 conjugal transfer protein TraF [Rickettsia endosymbiont of Ixodes persulcatus]MCZ6908928.1 conjugal transfer protein TraF [Rickettsia endosymbiont of Ixodes persulcatus]MCZ6914611.1 conjugal transfer protein TraF [Rickettsia endosymbiont of Ixodes persulcatus]MCZ6919024.1 conjugal transfer protein TraF [Rickettsia endosymbiont of Ixodes persulcatus]